MSKVNYVEVTSSITYYLSLYPHVGVALEATLEDVEGNQKIAKEVRNAMERIYNGEEDTQVLSEWANETGARSLEKLSDTIKEARSRGEDIGLYARRLSPRKHNEGHSNRPRRNRNKRYYKHK